MTKILRFALIACLPLAAACNNGSSTLAPTAPLLTTETFGGILPKGAGLTAGIDPKVHAVTLAVAGTIAVTLVSVGPPATTAIGLGVGTPATDGSCPVSSGFLVQAGVQVVGPGAAGGLCVALWDPGIINGVDYSLQADVNYVITIQYPK